MTQTDGHTTRSGDPSAAPAPVYALRAAVFTALFAALFAALSSVAIPVGAVPVTLQTFGAMIAGGLLGARYGFASVMLVVVLAAAGLPILHGKGGLAYVLGPTGGYIFSFPFAALLIGWATDRLYKGGARSGRMSPVRLFLLFAAMAVFGAAFPYLIGVPWLAYRADMTLAAAIASGMVPFLAGDALKAVAAALVVAALRPYVPKLGADRRASGQNQA
jgi:biotin transport system substrate-specific component